MRLLNELPVASVSEPGGQLTLKKWWSENLEIITCISCIYFIAAVNHVRPGPQRFTELMPLRVVQTMTW